MDDGERATSARKCLSILGGTTPFPLMRAKDFDFYSKHVDLAKNIRYAPSEPELQWLRDLVSRYVTN